LLSRVASASAPSCDEVVPRALHSSSATPAAPDRNAKLNALHRRFWNLGWEPRNTLALFQPASVSRRAGGSVAVLRQLHQLRREGAGDSDAHTLSCIASQPLRLGFGFRPRE